MGTRCQVKVQDIREAITLYHHYDGYPSNILKLLKDAWEFDTRSSLEKEMEIQALGKIDEYNPSKDWKKCRVGKVASFLCAVDPCEFEPEDSHELHGDIDYYYVITLIGEKHCGALIDWLVYVYHIKDFEPDIKTQEPDYHYNLSSLSYDEDIAVHG